MLPKIRELLIYPKPSMLQILGCGRTMCLVLSLMSMKRKLSELVDPMKQLKGELKVIKRQLKIAQKAADKEMEAFLRKCNAEYTTFKAALKSAIRQRETKESKKKLKATLKGVVDKGMRKRKRDLHYENLWYSALQNDDVIKEKANVFHKGFTTREEQKRGAIRAKHAILLTELEERETKKEDEIWSTLGSDEEVSDDEEESEEESEDDVEDEDEDGDAGEGHAESV